MPHTMHIQARQIVISVVYLAFWVALGFWGLPAFTVIFVESGQSIPWPTVQLLRQGLAGCFSVGITGAALIITIEEFTPSAALRRALLLALCVPVAAAVAVLLWPLAGI